MKRNPLLTFAVAPSIGAGLLAAWLTFQNPPSQHNAALSSPASHPARADSDFHNQDSSVPSSSSSNPKQASQAFSEVLPALSSQSRSVATGRTQDTVVPQPQGAIASESSSQIQQDASTPGVQPTQSGPSPGLEPPPAATVPLAFQPLPPSVAAANPQLADAVQGLQQDFVKRLGGPNQDPTTPAYYNRWIAAAASIDEQYHILVGDQQFLSEQMQVNNQ
jgi:hypothetical protein